ncbi:tryptophan synthase beta subunit-like PLP-dependent enzyme [Rostrohypoxylon terebratum]|nr:tryptophan synthase beta subunit-like PLP-dependent enzyme [Rostrohypoxylon terebratum]
MFRSKITNTLAIRPPAREWVFKYKSDGAESGFHEPATKLHSLPKLAKGLDKCGLSAFKILGVSWAIYRAVGWHLGLPVEDGSASLQEVAANAEKAVLGIDGDYGDVVSFAFEEAKAKGYDIIPRYLQVPELTGGKAATHAVMLVGAGSGKEFGPSKVLAVEPTTPVCLFESLKAGKSVSMPTEEIVMCGLNCGVLSTIVWPILRHGIYAAVMVSDLESRNAVGELSTCDISAGPCGAVILAAI